MKHPKNILSIAGSDPSGGAGIQADIKTFSALGCYGMAAVTALTAQNTQGVSGVHEVPAAFVEQQIRAVFADIDVHAVKIGMAGAVETIGAIAAVLQEFRPAHIVLDPVMAAQSGDRLIGDDAIRALKEKLVPLATLLTPNIPEAEILLGEPFTGDGENFARDLLDLGAPAVLLKGGHMEGATASDMLAYTGGVLYFEKPRIKTKNNHGTGCALSAALACFLAQGLEIEDSCEQAKDYITKALRESATLSVGKGGGPVHHFHTLWHS